MAGQTTDRAGEMTMTCHVCGNEFTQKTGGRGRPRHFCSEDCRELAAAYTVLQSKLDAAAGRMTKAVRNQWRRELWTTANSLNGRTAE